MPWNGHRGVGAALTAMRERSSIAEILAVYESGAVSGLEVLGAAWKQCHNQPSLREQLVRQFRNCPDEYIAGTVGGGLERFAAQAAGRATQK